MRKRLLLTATAVVLGGLVTLYILVQPTRQLDLIYTKVPWNERVRGAILNLGVLSLSEEDISNLVKEQISRHPAAKQLPIAGVAVELEYDQAIVYLKVQKGGMSFGMEVRGTVALRNEALLFTPTAYRVGRIPLSAEAFQRIAANTKLAGRTPVVWNLRPLLPREIGIKSVVVKKDQLDLVLTVSRLLQQP